MLKALIFDCGAVMHSLEDTNTREEIMEILLAGKLPREDVVLKYAECIEQFSKGEISEESFWKELCTYSGVPIPSHYRDLFRTKLRENAKAFPEMFELVDELKKRGYPVHMLSNTVAPHAEIIRKKGWYAPFDRVFLSCEVGMRKPNKNIYEHTLKEIGFKPDEILFIDDREDNLIPARELGMKTILAVSPEKIVKDVKNFLKL